MSNYNIHVCKCGATPKLIYPYSFTYDKFQVKCPVCGARTYIRNNNLKAIEEWNGKFD